MSNPTPGRSRFGWLAAALMLLVAGFVVGVTVTTGGSGGGGRVALPGALSTAESTAAPLTAAGETHSYAPVAEAIMPAVVNISTDKKVEMEQFEHPFMDDPFFRRFFNVPDGGNRERIERSLGSGVIVSEDGYILTSNHVIEKASKIRVLMQDKAEMEAKIVGQDPQTDVALIKIDAKGLPTARIGDSSALRIGDQVLAVGNPFGVGQSASLGIVSAMGRSMGLMQYEDFIQTDAAINPGNSGGALVNMSGELIGINTAILSRSGTSAGVGFAIPSNMARRIMESLIAHGKVQRAWLGVQIQPIDQAMAEAHGLDRARGVIVAEITKNAPAQRAGLQEGDIILELDGKEVLDVPHLRNQISLAGVGTTVRLTIWRDGKERTVPIKLEELPANPEIAAADDGDDEEGIGAGLEGVTVQELTPQRRRMLEVPEEIEGVVVVDVDQGSNAWRENLRQGNVIIEVFKQPVSSVKEFRELVARNESKPVLLRVWQRNAAGEGGSRLYLAVPR